MITLVKSQSNSKSLLAIVTQFKISLYIVLAMPKSRGNGSAGKRSTRQRTVVSSAGVGTRRSSRRAPATDQRSDALRPADRPPPSSSVADTSLEQLMEAVGNRVRQEMRAQSATLYQPPRVQSLPTSYQSQPTQSTTPCQPPQPVLLSTSCHTSASRQSPNPPPPPSESFLFSR